MATLLPLPSDLLERDGFSSRPGIHRGVPDLSSFCSIWAARTAAVGAMLMLLVSAVALVGCGRKAGLDAPPMAAPAPPPAAPDAPPRARPRPPPGRPCGPADGAASAAALGSFPAQLSPMRASPSHEAV